MPFTNKSTFDPESDDAHGRNQATIKRTYRDLLTRGKESKAEELRETNSLRDQLQVTKEVPDFDPEHDSPEGSGQMRIRTVYESLREAGYDDVADRLRGISSLNSQKRQAVKFEEEHLDE